MPAGPPASEQECGGFSSLWTKNQIGFGLLRRWPAGTDAANIRADRFLSLNAAVHYTSVFDTRPWVQVQFFPVLAVAALVVVVTAVVAASVSQVLTSRARDRELRRNQSILALISRDLNGTVSGPSLLEDILRDS